LIGGKTAKDHRQTNGEMDERETRKERSKLPDHIVKYREQLKMLFFVRV